MKPSTAVLLAGAVLLAISMFSVALAALTQVEVCDPNTPNPCAFVTASNNLQVSVQNASIKTKLLDAGGTNTAQVNNDGSVEVSDFGSNVTVSAADTSCHFVTAKSLNRIINGLGSAQSVSVTIYLNETTSNCTSTTTIVDQPGATQFQDVQIPITSPGTGFSYKWSGAPSGTVLFTSN